MIYDFYESIIIRLIRCQCIDLKFFILINILSHMKTYFTLHEYDFIFTKLQIESINLI